MANNLNEISIKTEPEDNPEYGATASLSSAAKLATSATTSTNKSTAIPSATAPTASATTPAVPKKMVSLLRPPPPSLSAGAASTVPKTHSATLQIMSDGGLRVVSKNPSGDSGFPSKEKAQNSASQQLFFMRRGTDGQLHLLMAPAAQPNKFFLLQPVQGKRFQLTQKAPAPLAGMPLPIPVQFAPFVPAVTGASGSTLKGVDTRHVTVVAASPVSNGPRTHSGRPGLEEVLRLGSTPSSVSTAALSLTSTAPARLAPKLVQSSGASTVLVKITPTATITSTSQAQAANFCPTAPGGKTIDRYTTAHQTEKEASRPKPKSKKLKPAVTADPSAEQKDDDNDSDSCLPVFFAPNKRRRKKKMANGTSLLTQALLSCNEIPDASVPYVATDVVMNENGVDTDEAAFPFRIESVFSLSSEEPAFDSPVLVESDTDTDIKSKVITITEEDFTQDELRERCGSSFVVLERLSKENIDEKGHVLLQSRCTEYCRKRTLNYMCMLDLIVCGKKRHIKLEEYADFTVKKEDSSEVKHEKQETDAGTDLKLNSHQNNCDVTKIKTEALPLADSQSAVDNASETQTSPCMPGVVTHPLPTIHVISNNQLPPKNTPDNLLSLGSMFSQVSSAGSPPHHASAAVTGHLHLPKSASRTKLLKTKKTKQKRMKKAASDDGQNDMHVISSGADSLGDHSYASDHQSTSDPGGGCFSDPLKPIDCTAAGFGGHVYATDSFPSVVGGFTVISPFCDVETNSVGDPCETIQAPHDIASIDVTLPNPISESSDENIPENSPKRTSSPEELGASFDAGSSPASNDMPSSSSKTVSSDPSKYCRVLSLTSDSNSAEVRAYNANVSSSVGKMVKIMSKKQSSDDAASSALVTLSKTVSDSKLISTVSTVFPISTESSSVAKLSAADVATLSDSSVIEVPSAAISGVKTSYSRDIIVTYQISKGNAYQVSKGALTSASPTEKQQSAVTALKAALDAPIVTSVAAPTVTSSTTSRFIPIAARSSVPRQTLERSAFVPPILFDDIPELSGQEMCFVRTLQPPTSLSVSSAATGTTSQIVYVDPSRLQSSSSKACAQSLLSIVTTQPAETQLPPTVSAVAKHGRIVGVMSSSSSVTPTFTVGGQSVSTLLTIPVVNSKMASTTVPTITLSKPAYNTMTNGNATLVSSAVVTDSVQMARVSARRHSDPTQSASVIPAVPAQAASTIPVLPSPSSTRLTTANTKTLSPAGCTMVSLLRKESVSCKAASILPSAAVTAALLVSTAGGFKSSVAANDPSDSKSVASVTLASVGSNPVTPTTATVNPSVKQMVRIILPGGDSVLLPVSYGAVPANKVPLSGPRPTISLLPSKLGTSSREPQATNSATKLDTAHLDCVQLGIGSGSVTVLPLFTKQVSSATSAPENSTENLSKDSDKDAAKRTAFTQEENTPSMTKETTPTETVPKNKKRRKYDLPPGVVIKTEPTTQSYPPSAEGTSPLVDYDEPISPSPVTEKNTRPPVLSKRKSNSNEDSDVILNATVLNLKAASANLNAIESSLTASAPIGTEGKIPDVNVTPELEPICDAYASGDDASNSPCYDEPPVLTPVYPLPEKKRKRTTKSKSLLFQDASVTPDTDQPPRLSRSCTSPHAISLSLASSNSTTVSSSITPSVTSSIASSMTSTTLSFSSLATNASTSSVTSTASHTSVSPNTSTASSFSASTSASSERIRQLKAMLQQQNAQLDQIRKERAQRGPLVLGD